MRRAAYLVGIAAMLGGIVGCGSSGNTMTGGAGSTGSGGASTSSGQGPTTTTTTSSSGAGGASTVSSSSAAMSSSGSGGGGPTFIGTCADDPPPGAAMPSAPKAYSGGVCPTLAAGYNTFTSMGNSRDFLLALPANLQPNEKVPIIFLWHWLKGSPDDFYTKGEVQAAVDSQRFIAVLPKAKGDLFFEWPFNVADAQSRMDEELAYFDDMLACVTSQFNTNPNCVASAGVSAGALFTDQLGAARADYLSSILSLSGGVDGLIRPWGHPAHHLPGIVLWGGPSDICVVLNFQDGSHALETALQKDGSFFLECVHNCGHSEPPFDAPMGLSKYAGLWQFVFDHPFWTSPGASPYKTKGMPVGMPDWCGIGAGSAVPRVGPCNGSGC